MGLLDQWSGDTDMQSPQNQYLNALSSALLQLGGPSLKPISFGQAWGGAMQAGNQAFQSAKDRKLAEDYKNEQLKLLKLDELRKQTEFNNKQKWFELANGTGQASTAPAQSIQQPLKLGMNADGGMGFQSQPNIQAPQNTASQPQGKTWLDRMSLADLALGEQMGVPVKSAIEAKKFMLTGIKRDPNSFIEDMNGNVRYIGDPTKGLDYNPETKTVSNLNGFNQANAAMKGAETAAVEAAKANLDFVPMDISQPMQLPNGQILQPGRYNLTRAQAAQLSGTGMPQGQPQAPQGQFAPQTQAQPQGQAPAQGLPQPANATQAELNQRSAQLRANQPQMDNDRLTILQQELAKETDPNNRAMIQREIARVGGQVQPQAPQTQQFAPQPQQAMTQPRFGIPLQSEAQRAEELANVKLRTEPALEQQTGLVKGKQGTANALNENWIKQRYNPTLEAGDKAKDVATSLDTLANVDFKTGWGSDAKIKGVSILVGLGMAPKNAEFYVGNGQVFQNEVMKQLVSTFEGQKGTQTEGDAKRVQQTFAQLSNTPYANQYIADLARAKANRDARKAAFYQEALPIAQQSGDLNEIDRRWMKLQGSIWNDPVLQKYKSGAK